MPCHLIPALQHVHSLANILQPDMVKDIVEALHRNPRLAAEMKEARETGKIMDGKFTHIPHADKIRARLQALPMFEGLIVKEHRVRLQGLNGIQNVHQDPYYYEFRAIVRISADGASASQLDFHAGQRQSNGRMKAGDRIAVLEIPHGEVGGSGGSAVAAAMSSGSVCRLL
jgi:hypothetical protein